MALRAPLAVLVLVTACSSSPPGEAADAAPGADAAACPSDPPYPADLVDLVGRSGWVFRATVVEQHAATEPQPPPFADPQGLWDLDRMIVVAIDDSSIEPQEAPLPAGSHDTVILTAPPGADLAVGQQAYFFVSWFLAGSSWVFVEQGHWSGDGLGFDDVHAAVHEARRYLLDRALYQRMAGAERVIRGTVLSVADLSDPESDNLPDWWEATVQPRYTLHGPVEIDPIQVRYQGGDNPCCVDMPRLAPGDDADLLIYPDTITGHPGPARVIADPLDRQLPRDEPRLRSLLASPPRPPRF